MKTTLEKGIADYGSDFYTTDTFVWKDNLKAPIKYIEAIDNSVTVSGVAYELGGAYADDSLNFLSNATALTPAMGIVAFPREVMEFTVSGLVKVYYASRPLTQLQLAGDNPMQLITDDNLEIVHF